MGEVKVSDGNVSDEFTYEVTGEHGWLFEVTPEGVLKLYGSNYADKELWDVLNITIIATDLNGLSFSQDFIIEVVDIDYTNIYVADTNHANWVVPATGNDFIDSLIFGHCILNI